MKLLVHDCVSLAITQFTATALKTLTLELTTSLDMRALFLKFTVCPGPMTS